jgi:hypothetical protein
LKFFGEKRAYWCHNELIMKINQDSVSNRGTNDGTKKINEAVRLLKSFDNDS